MRAALCIRVSPRPQDKVRYSPEIQEAKCREWCEANGHEVVLVIQDILVSGGSASRFDSIFAALDSQPIDVLVVSDLSRWTRDEPDRFWYINHVLKERGVKLFSVQESWLGGDMPFAATITTATVEANARERDMLRRKTSEGVRRAWASGKVCGRARFGWTWHSDSRSYSQDVPLITELFNEWINGATAMEIGRRFGIRGANVKPIIRSKTQRPIVGDELWLRAQSRDPSRRGVRADAKWGSPYRGMLSCPFCGGPMQRHSSAFYNYFCKYGNGAHDWRTLSVRKYVTPAVLEALATLRMPDDEVAALAMADQPVVRKSRDVAGEMDRLGELFVRGRLSVSRYEKLTAELEAERDAEPVPERPVPERLEILRTLDILDFDDRSVVGGTLVNRILREVLSIRLSSERIATATISPAYAAWRAPVL